ncbi:hypothetical protein, partial [Cellulophaga sp. BC115SP]|uniref:hypothetical protein n=1 Tax=Cellulophaga sp. BC115SP TaxID=2683263 RepID=UPI001412233A
IDQQFNLLFPQVQGNYEFDMYTGDQTNTGLWFIECKSTDELPADMGQLSAYFSVIRNISNLEYIFNTKKAGTETQAKQAVQKQLYNGTALINMGTNLFNTIWGNTALRGSLFPNLDYTNKTIDELKPEAILLFKAMVGNTSNSFYNFIKTK